MPGFVPAPIHSVIPWLLHVQDLSVVLSGRAWELLTAMIVSSSIRWKVGKYYVCAAVMGLRSECGSSTTDRP